MAYEFFYPGASYPLEPTYGDLFTGYRIPFAELGAPTSIQTANQIQEVTNLLSQGGKTIELQPLSPEVFEAIPKQHFKEINRLTKLTGTETTVHAPMIDPAGFTKEGWSEVNRDEAERELKSIVERSHNLSPEGNMPVTIHASAIPGTEYSKPSEKLISDYKKQVQERYGRMPTQEELKQLEESRIIVVNQETKQLVPIEREEKYYPEEGKVIRVPEQEIRTINNTEWVNSITNLAFYKKEADEILIPSYKKVLELQARGIPSEKEKEEYEAAIDNLNRARLFLNNVETSFRALYNRAYKYGDEETKRELEGISKNWKEKYEIMQKEKNPVNLIITESNLIDNTLKAINVIKPPQVYKKIEDFAIDNAAQTLGNTAFSAYEKFKDKTPIISIENLYPGMAFSRSEELKNLVDEARKKFVENAKKKGFSESAARKEAEKLIGVTWDLGHINILRKSGYKPEEIIKETEKIAKFVKHVHLSDNFGFADIHLPPGMGEVPIKEILKELEKAGVKAKKIVEAGGFVQHFKVSPTQYILEASGSPLYSMMAQPYWNQIVSTYGSYFAFPLGYFPEQHFSIYGTGFSGLPQELGGQIPGKQQRTTGTPMA